MARSFRTSGFRRSFAMDEDVNPSAYIVNLADCMLVLACGFLVALVARFNLDVSAPEKIDTSEMTEVAPETIEEEIVSGDGSYYIDAGRVYQDPETGNLYLVQSDSQTGSTGGTSGSRSSANAADSSSRSSSSAIDARANGAD
ncbi:DUF2149 domain-containing protein [Gordonibacter sp. Marseille-P4307]|uniref:DUF2149 domain-containing protein n=1 Tax=Gordonibacter sp. Marseille-P4307 TaxID=2161815 RepID=UPI0013DE173C|nr:DUF2149 domain-containing protein [Gordonibacter sp. Marseille-P4307]